MSVSVHRLRKPRLANEAVVGALEPAERTAMISAAAAKLEELFDVLQIDHRNDHNTRDTPSRVARMLVEETLSGRYCEAPGITEFDNPCGFDQLIITGPIDVRSTCAHHLMPIYGHAFVGILPAPDGRIIGLSKYDRVVDHFASRLQIQEELVKQIGDYLMAKTSPLGLAVRISAVHMCKTHRGVRASHRGRMVSSAYWGAFSDDEPLKAEFLQECAGLTVGPPDVGVLLRNDARAIWRSTKTYGHEEGLSCCFRQWRATHSHCRLLHGYALAFSLTFATDTLDARNWCFDFGGLKPVRAWLHEMFDHTLLVAHDDPDLSEFQRLAERGLVDLRRCARSRV